MKPKRERGNGIFVSEYRKARTQLISVEQSCQILGSGGWPRRLVALFRVCRCRKIAACIIGDHEEVCGAGDGVVRGTVWLIGAPSLEATKASHRS